MTSYSNGQMTNPWLALPKRAPYILPEDREELLAHGVTPDSLGLNLNLLPVPWNGDLTHASVLLLTLNPSVRANARTEELDKRYRELILANLRFESDPPLFNFHERFRATEGYAYWLRLLGALVSRFGIDHISRRVAVVEYFPYRSAVYRNPRCILPSQRFSWSLVRRAVDQQAAIVVQRGWAEWAQAVPELTAYPCIRLRNVRSPFLSEGNMAPGDWNRLVAALST